MDSVMDRVRDWARSNKGQKRINNRLYEMRKKGINTTGAGDHITTFYEMRGAAEILIALLRSAAVVLPESVQRHFDDLRRSPISETFKGNYTIAVAFTGDLHRMSLLAKKKDGRSYRTGRGIDNIVSLFDTGYVAERRVRGLWTGHEELGPILSKTEREGLHFMQDTIDLFNATLGKQYNVKAVIVSTPEGYYGVRRAGDDE